MSGDTFPSFSASARWRLIDTTSPTFDDLVQLRAVVNAATAVLAGPRIGYGAARQSYNRAAAALAVADPMLTEVEALVSEPDGTDPSIVGTDHSSEFFDILEAAAETVVDETIRTRWLAVIAAARPVEPVEPE
jgi:hypothetical protein